CLWARVFSCPDSAAVRGFETHLAGCCARPSGCVCCASQRRLSHNSADSRRLRSVSSRDRSQRLGTGISITATVRARSRVLRSNGASFLAGLVLRSSQRGGGGL